MFIVTRHHEVRLQRKFDRFVIFRAFRTCLKLPGPSNQLINSSFCHQNPFVWKMFRDSKFPIFSSYSDLDGGGFYTWELDPRVMFCVDCDFDDAQIIHLGLEKNEKRSCIRIMYWVSFSSFLWEVDADPLHVHVI